MKIGYFADGPWGHSTFDKLVDDKDIEIKFICVRYDTEDDTFKNYCQKYKIDYLKYRDINSNNCLKKIKKYNCDLFISMSFNQIFKNKIINLPPLKTINCHSGKLPFYRGRNILNWALINDEKEFGITVHYIDEGIDTGDIILQETFPISDSDDYSTLLQKAYEKCPILLYKAVKKIKNGTVKIVKQASIHPTGFYCSQRKEGDEIIKWNQSSRDIFNFIRAISKPGPQARSSLDNNEVIINKVQIIKNAPDYKGIPGTVLSSRNNELIIKTKDSFIKVVEWESALKIKIGNRLN